MPPFDIPALTRGISGLFTASAEGKRDAEDRARKQQRLVMADILSQKRVQEFVDRGRRERERLAKAEEDKLVKAEQTLKDQRARLAVLTGQLEPGTLEGIVGFSTQKIGDQIKTASGFLDRQRAKVVRAATIASRVPRATTEPKPLTQDTRVRRVVSLYTQLLEKGLNPEDDPFKTFMSGRALGEPAPVDTSAVKQQAMLEATNRFKHEFTEEELPELTSILEGIVGGEETPTPSGADGLPDDVVKEMIFDLNAQGLSRKEIQEELARQGISIELQ